MNLLKNRLFTLCEVYTFELHLTTVKMYQLYEYFPELMKQKKRIAKEK